MSHKRAIGNDQITIIYEIASTASMINKASLGAGIFEDSFFNKIAVRGFMLLSLSAIVVNLRGLAEGLI